MPEGILGSTAMEKLLRDRKSGNGNFPNGWNSAKEERGKGGRGGIPGQLHIPGNSWDKPAGNGPESSREFSKAARNPKNREFRPYPCLSRLGCRGSLRIRLFPDFGNEGISSHSRKGLGIPNSRRIRGLIPALPSLPEIPDADPDLRSQKIALPTLGKELFLLLLRRNSRRFFQLQGHREAAEIMELRSGKTPGNPNIPAHPRPPESTESESRPGTATP